MSSKAILASPRNSASVGPSAARLAGTKPRWLSTRAARFTLQSGFDLFIAVPS